jgi:malate synthase
MNREPTNGVTVRSDIEYRDDRILTPEALGFLAELHRRFNPIRLDLLRQRVGRQRRLDAGGTLGFLPETKTIREDSWTIAAVPPDLQDRRVEITGPTDRKMVINALNSGARVFMADFEDANTPAWKNIVEGQQNLWEAVRRTLRYTSAEGKEYRLNPKVATLLVRPRGWHLPEKHLLVGGEPMSGSLVDFGLYLYHNGKELLNRGTGPYFYLPKMESHLEARLWDQVFRHAEATLGMRDGTVKATVLIETIPAAFEMDEILYELRAHAAGLNAGRWDYIFSIIKKFRGRKEFIFPDRAQITMTVPFMRRAHAIGGMAAFIPSRKDPKVNEVALAKVREDKVREATDGFDGTWVAHPDLVPIATDIFDEFLKSEPNQVKRIPEDRHISSSELLGFRVPDGRVTEGGVAANVNVAIQYLESWLRGVGAAAISNLMEDTATAEIARSQVWQWVHHAVRPEGGTPLARQRVIEIVDRELAKIRSNLGPDLSAEARLDEARRLFENVALSDPFVEFLTLPAYALID